MEQELLRQEVLSTLATIDKLWGPVLVAVVLTIVSWITLNLVWRD